MTIPAAKRRQSGIHRLANGTPLGVETQVFEQHRRREDRRHRVGDVLARGLRVRSVDRLEKGRIRPDTRRRQHPQRPADDTRLVGQDVPEHVLRDDHVEVRRLPDDLHRRVVHEHVVHLHLRVFGRDALRRLPPQPRGFQHVRLVDDRQTAAARHRQTERHMQHPLDLPDRIGAGVEGPFAPFVAPLRTPEVDAARQLANAHEVRAPHHLRAQRGTVRQGLEQRHRAQVRKQPQRLAHPQQPLFGAHLRRRVVVVLRVPDRPEQHRVRRLADPVRLLRVGIPHRVDRRSAHQRPRIADPMAETFGNPVQNLHGLRDDFGADAVTGQQCNLDFHDSYGLFR